MTFIGNIFSIRSGLKTSQLTELQLMADTIAATIKPVAGESSGAGDSSPGVIDPGAMFKLTYGLFVLTAKDGDKDNGCIINTTAQLTQNPLRISIAAIKANYTHDMIMKTGEFNVSILTQDVPFRIFEQFGFQSGRNVDKFDGSAYTERTKNGIRYLPEFTNGVISGKVIDSYDYGTHTLFVADVAEAIVLPGGPSVTYQYYFDNIKPKPQVSLEPKKGFVCKICGYFHEGDELPDDFVCPLCKHGASDFEPAG